MASHDLQEPLWVVSGYVQLARRSRDGLDSEAREFIDYAVDGTARMLRLIEELLDYSRISSASRRVEPTDLERVVASVIAGFRVAIDEFSAEVSHDPLPTVPGDGVQLAHVFQNLIHNALEYRGADPSRLHIGCEDDGTAWRISVRDNGIGIDEDHFARSFALFKRLHRNEDYAGTGVGLARCTKIVERYGGRIWVESESGLGSDVSVYLVEITGLLRGPGICSRRSGCTRNNS